MTPPDPQSPGSVGPGDAEADRLVRAAELMKDDLLAEQAAVEERGFYSDQMHRRFVEAGFYRILQPVRFGGLEQDVTTFFRVIMAIGRGCPSTAWCLSLASGHALMLASHWEEQAQKELFGSGHFIAPHRAAPSGTLTAVDGGYRVDGTWNYASGVPYATHLMGGARVADVQGKCGNEVFVVVVPIEKCVRLNDWGGGQTLGLNGTGSFSVKVDGVVVPRNWVVPFDWHNRDLSEGTPGTRLHGNSMYLGRNLSFYGGELIAAMAGLGRAAVDASEQILRARNTVIGPPIPRTESADFLRYFGHGLGKIECAEQLVIQAGNRYTEMCKRWADHGTAFTEREDIANNSLLLHSAELVDEATRLFFATAGTSAARRDSKLARYVRDIMTQRTHLSGWGTLANMGEIRGRAEITGCGISPD